jgi:hypothetical protein
LALSSASADGDAERGPPVVFRGALHTVDERALAEHRRSWQPLLWAPHTAFQAALHPAAADGIRPHPRVTNGAHLAASALALAGGGRAVVCGAAHELFSDRAFRRLVARSAAAAAHGGALPGNERWAARVSAWLMHDDGVFRIARLRWAIRDAAATQPRALALRADEQLPVGKQARGSFVLEERVNGQWLRAALPHGSACGLALELSQLGLLHRRALAAHLGDAEFEAPMDVPLSAGTYDLRVRQCDCGEGFGVDVDAGELVARPLRRDEHARFLVEVSTLHTICVAA